MNDSRPIPGQSTGGASGAGRWAGSGWSDVTLCALLVLAVAVPTMAIEEDWHGIPMIDQPSHLWMVAGGLVAGAFVIGGAWAGHLHPRAAAPYAIAAGALAVAVLLGAATVRRLWFVHEGVPNGVARLWLFGVLVALSLSAAGSQLGRWLTTAAR
jgi:hypothetical protein